jgi:hypothetical protein
MILENSQFWALADRIVHLEPLPGTCDGNLHLVKT